VGHRSGRCPSLCRLLSGLLGGLDRLGRGPQAQQPPMVPVPAARPPAQPVAPCRLDGAGDERVSGGQELPVVGDHDVAVLRIPWPVASVVDVEVNSGEVCSAGVDIRHAVSVPPGWESRQASRAARGSRSTRPRTTTNEGSKRTRSTTTKNEERINTRTQDQQKQDRIRHTVASTCGDRNTGPR
jgi:hypothetical protein